MSLCKVIEYNNIRSQFIYGRSSYGLNERTISFLSKPKHLRTAKEKIPLGFYSEDFQKFKEKIALHFYPFSKSNGKSRNPKLFRTCSDSSRISTLSSLLFQTGREEGDVYFLKKILRSQSLKKEFGKF